MHPSALSRFEKGHRLPEASTLVRLSETLGVTTDWLLTGRTVAAEGAIPPPPPPPPGLDMTLPGFLQLTADRGLARWAAGARKGDVPTVAEALHALDTLTRSPALANDKGEPRDGWLWFFRQLRSPRKKDDRDELFPRMTEGRAFADVRLEVPRFTFREFVFLPGETCSFLAPADASISPAETLYLAGGGDAFLVGVATVERETDGCRVHALRHRIR